MTKSTTKAVISAPSTQHPDDRESDQYPAFRDQVIRRWNTLREWPVFTTDAKGLYQAYLAALPEEARQHYNCRRCQEFIEKYGGLVVQIDGSGITEPAMWGSDCPAFFYPAAIAMSQIVRDAKITGVFISSEKVYGTPSTAEFGVGVWHHFCAVPSAHNIHYGVPKTAEQVMAERVQEHIMLTAALEKYPAKVVKKAVGLFKTESLFRSEKFSGPANWFLDLHTAIAKKPAERKANIIWIAVSGAPAGFCHIGGSVVGTVFDDIIAGLTNAQIAKRFGKKTDTTKYQRPKAAPTEGNKEQAEKLFAKTGAAASLKRRYARLGELPLIWAPAATKAKAPSPDAVFAKVKTKKVSAAVPEKVQNKPVTITWEKFQHTVLQEALEIQFWAGNRHSYAGLLTAVDLDAPPIIIWDSLENRNPFSWYFLDGIAPPMLWNLQPGWVNVTGITLKPCMWSGEFPQFGKGAMFVLENCKDLQKRNNPGLCLFPEILKNEYHSVRATIEGYSNTEHLEGWEEGSASGVMADAVHGEWGIQIRVTTRDFVIDYILDRWD